MAGRRSGNEGSTDSSGDDEDSESSSSSSLYDLESRKDHGVLLSQFREKWKAEIQEKSGSSGKVEEKNDNLVSKGIVDTLVDAEDPRENEAKRLFRLGTREEANGNLYVAIEYYRRAYQLQPDVESQIALQQRRRRRNSHRKRLDSGSSVDSSGSASADVRGAEGPNVEALYHLVEGDEAEEGDKNNNGCVTDKKMANDDGEIDSEEKEDASNRNGWCQPEIALPDSERHISDLPIEVMLYIFKWVIGSHLDIRALGQLSLVCRCFTHLSRDEELWRLVCVRIWGANCGLQPTGYLSWRNMAICRPHVLLNGCYMGRVTYVRRGEPSLGASYHPCYIVEYYRSIRFYPDGIFYMMTTPDPPDAHVRLLKSRPPSRVVHGVLEGHYRLNGEVVTGVLQWRKPAQQSAVSAWRLRRRQPAQQSSDQLQMFHVQFLLKSSKKKQHNVLEWQSYSFVQKSKSGKEVVCDFNIKSDAYPVLYFSRVKSYTADVTDQPLE